MLNVYCTEWCPDCRRTFRYLDSKGVAYRSIDIEKLSDKELMLVIAANNGNGWVTPTFEYKGRWLAYRHIEIEDLPGIFKELGVE